MSRKNEHLILGQEGENFAADYLQNQGYKILHKNYRYKRGEVDIIVENDKFTVFVEVKTRSEVAYGNPEEAVDSQKESLIKSVAEEYMSKNTIKSLLRFDIIALVKKDGNFEIRHFEDAF